MMDRKDLQQKCSLVYNVAKLNSLLYKTDKKQDYLNSSFRRACNFIINKVAERSTDNTVIMTAVFAAVTVYFAFSGIDPISTNPDELRTRDEAELYKMYCKAERFYLQVDEESRTSEAFIEQFADFVNAEPLLAIATENIVIPNNKLANVLTKGIVDAGSVILNVAGRNEKISIETVCELTMLTFEGDTNISLTARQRFTEYDRNVLNAIVSLYKIGNTILTPAMVARAMNGMNKKGEKPSDEQIARVKLSMDKMLCIYVKIDCSREWQAHKVQLNGRRIDKGYAASYMFPASVVSVTAGGQLVSAYKLLDVPIIYEYASAVGQILNVESKVLAVKKVVDGKLGNRIQNTDTHVLIKGYLIRRIEGMKGRNGLKNRVISLDANTKNGENGESIYSVATLPADDGSIPQLSRAEKKRIREATEAILDYWKVIEYIADYEPVFQSIPGGKRISGYKITLHQHG